MVNSMERISGRLSRTSFTSRVAIRSLLLSVAIVVESVSALGQWTEYRDRFEIYVEPRVPVEFYGGERFLLAKLSAGISFNQSGEPTRITFGRVIEEGGISIDDPLWQAMERNARKAIEQWKVRLRLWTADDIPDSTLRARMNENPYHRPDRGFQFHLVVFVFIRGISHSEIRTIGVVNVERPEEE